ncbi:TIGR03087 family PEP-CTERM/XrtA system glycosyltransferase [uncultured Sphingomonas sp.]|uniref:TIGR03087 family PEP-CTERM/XrtA system glycosyltransferase n=1 Tax=uncultured Sphingomonas sp. TaxID=158754 RepID=UPI002614DCD8|nr:TIGR03087 family PEP-CTERM/XrtA system glycosyltransferase [uncultured Sphingomonas sp.]
MNEILFLAHRVPFPPDRGDKIRSYHVLRHLAARARVHLVTFADDPRDLVPAPEYRALVDECVVVPRTKSRARAAIEALATAQPLSLTAFAHHRVAAAVRDILARRPIDAIYVFSGQMAQYLPVSGPRAIMDFVDLDSAKFAAYAGDARGLTRYMMRREARLLSAFEREVAGRVDARLFVSAAEAALLPGSIAIENGIDTAHYDPGARHVPVVGQGPLIVFTGQMDYRPNIDAVIWFAREMLPRIPGARFAIVGRAPTAEVRALAGERVIVTGEVADVRGWLAAASVVVAPLKLARGIQNKVLEAMAMARPVVASAAAAEGIDHDGTIRVAGDADGFVAAVNALLGDRDAAAALGKAARARVIARYDWAAALAPLDELIGIAPAPRVAA